MTYQAHSFSIEDALNSSQETYDVDFSDWGFRRDPLKPEENIRFPPPGQRAISTTLAGLSIGPRSTVDRCWVSWDRQKNLQDPTGIGPSLFTSQLRELSVGTPLLYSQATNIGTLIPGEDTDVAMQRGLLYVFSHDRDNSSGPHLGDVGATTILPAFYADQFGVSRAMAPGAFSPFDFESPFLHLVLRLRPFLSPAPTKRFPMNRTLKVPVALASPRTRVALVPIFGRKHVRVQIVSRADPFTFPATLARVCDFYVGLIRNVNESNIVGPQPTANSPVCEINAGTALGVPATEIPVGFQIDNPCADYLAIYATATVGDASVIYTVSAED